MQLICSSFNMQYARIYQSNVFRVSILVVAAAALFFSVRELSLEHSRSPLEITYRVRNASARESEWQVAVAAQPADMIEHFVLVRLAQDVEQPVRSVRFSIESSGQEQYREQTLASVSQGINEHDSERI